MQIRIEHGRLVVEIVAAVLLVRLVLLVAVQRIEIELVQVVEQRTVQHFVLIQRLVVQVGEVVVLVLAVAAVVDHRQLLLGERETEVVGRREDRVDHVVVEVVQRHKLGAVGDVRLIEKVAVVAEAVQIVQLAIQLVEVVQLVIKTVQLI